MLSARVVLVLAFVLPVSACAGRASDHPSSASSHTAVRAVLISDLNSAYGATTYGPAVGAVISHITSTWNPDLVLAAGDVVAGQAPQLEDGRVRAMWQAFDSAVAAPLRTARIPLVATPGNHDASAYPAHARDRRIAVEYWRSAERTVPLRFVDRDSYPLRYAVQYGTVFIAVWDGTNQDTGRDPELLGWLQRVLSTPEARASRHRVVLSHLPLYGIAVGRDRDGEVLAAGDSVRTLLETWGATVFISGHHHAYYPGRRGALDLLYAGALGNGPRPLVGDTAAPYRTVTLLDFLADSLALTTYRVDEDTGELSPVPLESLPTMICGVTGWVSRRDVAATDTMCEARRGSSGDARESSGDAACVGDVACDRTVLEVVLRQL